MRLPRNMSGQALALSLIQVGYNNIVKRVVICA